MELPRPVEQVRSPTAVARSLEELLGDSGAAATAIHDGRRLQVPSGGITIGRELDNDVVVSAALASRYHARIVQSDGRWYLADLGSTNGTFLNGERLVDEARWLQSGDTIAVGGEVVRFLLQEPESGSAPGEHARIPLTKRLTIGRDSGNDIQLSGPAISGVHAEIVMSGDRVEVIDHGSRSGTRVNGTVIDRAQRPRPGDRDRGRLLPADLRRRELRPARRHGGAPAGGGRVDGFGSLDRAARPALVRGRAG